MKLRKAAALVAGLAVLTMVLTGCGSPKEATFTSKDNIVITATDQWKQLESKEDLAELYTDKVDDELAESVDLALKMSGKVYFTVEKLDVSSDMSDMKDMAEMLKEFLAEYDKEEVTAMLKSSDFSEDEISILYKVVEDGADFDLIYQEMSNVDWFNQLETGSKDYKFVGSEEATILGQASSISEYSYTNNDDAKLHFYEASFVKDGVLYTLNGWCEDSAFDKNKDALKSMITTAKWAE